MSPGEVGLPAVGSPLWAAFALRLPCTGRSFPPSSTADLLVGIPIVSSTVLSNTAAISTLSLVLFHCFL